MKKVKYAKCFLKNRAFIYAERSFYDCAVTSMTVMNHVKRIEIL